MTPEEEAGKRYDASGRAVFRSGRGDYLVVLRDDLPLAPEVIGGEPAAIFRESEIPYLRSLSKEALQEEVQARKGIGIVSPEAASEFLPPPPPPAPPKPKPSQRTPAGQALLNDVLDIMDGRLLGDEEVLA